MLQDLLGSHSLLDEVMNKLDGDSRSFDDRLPTSDLRIDRDYVLRALQFVSASLDAVTHLRPVDFDGVAKWHACGSRPPGCRLQVPPPACNVLVDLRLPSEIQVRQGFCAGDHEKNEVSDIEGSSRSLATLRVSLHRTFVEETIDPPHRLAGDEGGLTDREFVLLGHDPLPGRTAKMIPARRINYSRARR